jgi:hypothetical protein
MDARAQRGPSLAANMARDVGGRLGRRLFEALAVTLAFWVVSLQSHSLDFFDYFDSAWGIGASAGLGWGLRTIAPSGNEGWIGGILRTLGVLLIFLALFAAIFGRRALPKSPLGFGCF